MFTPAEQAVLREVLDHPEDLARRLVLADMLLERGERLGELLRLECTPGPLDLARITALRTELEPGLRRELYPYAVSVGFDGGLPFTLEVDMARLRANVPQGEPSPLPVRWLRLSGDPGFVFNLLRQPVCERLECLDLSRAGFDTPYTQFVGEAPPPVPRLKSLRRLWVPDAPPPAHWLPLVRETFLDVEVLSVRGSVFSLDQWLELAPKTRCLDFRGLGRRVPLELRERALAFVKEAPGRTLRVASVEVAPEHLDEALLDEPRHQVPLSDVANPPFDKVDAVEVHRFLDEGEHLADATIAGARGLWLRLKTTDSFIDQVRVAHSVRLAMMAPLHPHLVVARRAAKHGRDMWLLLPDGLKPLEPSPDSALRDALQLGRALKALAPYLAQHASPLVNALPVSRWCLLRNVDVALQLLVPADLPYHPEHDALAWGTPVELTPRDLARGVAAVLLQWLTGRPLALLTAPGGTYSYADHVAMDRARQAPLPAGLPEPLAPLLARACSPRFEERLTLDELLAALERLAA